MRIGVMKSTNFPLDCTALARTAPSKEEEEDTNIAPPQGSYEENMSMKSSL